MEPRGLAADHVRIAPPMRAEMVVKARHQCARAHIANQLFQIELRLRSGARGVEGFHQHAVHAHFFEYRQLLVQPHQLPRRISWRKHRQRVTVEGADHAGAVYFARQLHGALDQRPMSRMQAVEGTQRQHAGRQIKFRLTAPYPHAPSSSSKSIALKRTLPSGCVSPMPAKRPSR